VRLGPLRTPANIWPSVRAPGDDDDADVYSLSIWCISAK
jgi:hypothetical protein